MFECNSPPHNHNASLFNFHYNMTSM
ncbi:Bgt-51602 [Blumeria graminis f. sp. tritici]|uniref:Bgt-51602 n=1 Tax=Blumeria graminis f. sp. tritici TaxID=62690 RepID=A0A9X9MP16_BLUGR|nr:Bgt-51602 [Blumeria graminis f. sp. tritici]